MTINKEHMELWIQALESDQHQQCVGALREQGQRGGTFLFPNGTMSWFPAQPEMHCALGIGVMVALAHGVKEYNEWGERVWDETNLPYRFIEFYGVPSSDPEITIDGIRDSIVNHNDMHKHTFWAIAQAMRTEFLKDEG